MKSTNYFVPLLAGLACLLLSAAHVLADSYSRWVEPAVSDLEVCTAGVGVPPFLGTSIDPNLLVILDNSGSMYDPAYTDVDNSGECYDDSYDPTKTYGGYFTPSAWYVYDFPSQQFEQSTAADVFAPCDSSAGGLKFSKDSVLCITDDNTDGNDAMESVNNFGAIGGFLNWAAASKFDIEKIILTGGKHEGDVATNDLAMVMETRGCLNSRFVKSVTLDQIDSVNNTNYTLSLAVRPPEEEDIARWDENTSYQDGDKVVFQGDYYIADSSRDPDYPTDSAIDAGVEPPGDDWAAYDQNRWYPGVDYEAGDVVFDMISGKMYQALTSGTSRADAVELAYDTSITWEQYNVTHIEVYSVTAGTFNYQPCEDALAEMDTLVGDDSDQTSLGRLKSAIEECMGYDQGQPNTEEGYQKAAFNHSMQECWYYNKFDRFQPGSGSVNSLRTACENIYDTINPGDLTPWDSAYVCAGEYGAFPPYRYVGRCWEPPAGSATCEDASCPDDKIEDEEWYSPSDKVLYKCVDDAGSAGKLKQCTDVEKVGTGNDKTYQCTTTFQLIQDCESDAESDEYAWTNDDFYLYDTCPYNTCGLNDCVVETCVDYDDADDNTCLPGDTADAVCDWAADLTWSRDNNESNPAKTGWLVNDDGSLGKDSGYFCVDQALRDFCNVMQVPEVIDPSDATALTGEAWNAPAMLVDSGIISQLDKPIATLQGYIASSDEPEGILQEVADDLRIGIMTFNRNGAATECAGTLATADDAIQYDCPDDNKDGARLIAYIDQGDEHTERMVAAVNDIKADAWTPLAEAMYNALGYYTQKSGDEAMRLNDVDFLFPSEVGDPASLSQWGDSISYTEGDLVRDSANTAYMALSTGISSGSGPADDVGVNWLTLPTGLDPVEYGCQNNNILILTEGASTADINQTVKDFVAPTDGANEAFDGDQTADAGCTDGLHGSTFLDDLTWYGHNTEADDLYASCNLEGEDKKNISTYIVTTGMLRNSDPDDAENECSPEQAMEEAAANGRTIELNEEVLFEGENPALLEAKLKKVLSKIMTRASAGSAASVISSSRDGDGAVYQAIFWPEQARNLADLSDKLKWAGTVHSLFINDEGWLFEDTDGNARLNTEDENGNGVLDDGEDDNEDEQLSGDRRVIFYYDDGENETRVCLNDSVTTTGTCDNYQSLLNIKYIWDANDWLAGLSDTELRANRGTDADGTWDFTTKRRYIFTWNDLNNDGIVNYGVTDDNEVLPLVVNDTLVDWDNLAVDTTTRGPVLGDFAAGSDDEIKNVISWTRGIEQYDDETATGVDADGNGRLDEQMRDRRYSTDGMSVQVWRLGDIIHSAPTVVASPAEAYHYVYRDESYMLFSEKYKKRRNVIYYGGNDGMLHAVNGGFFVEDKKGFVLCAEDERDTSGECQSGMYPALGAELWAYVPYNLQPHLKCLSDPDYMHKYFVDQRPRIFDVQIFEDDCAYDAGNQADCTNAEHPGGWGTILVGGMGFGGEPLEARDINGESGDTRRFQSAYFILDITNPEKPPVLLGEMTRDVDFTEHAALGYTIPSPTLVVMRDTSGNYPAPDPATAITETYAGVTKWYLVLGNGPTTQAGENHALHAQLGILPLAWLKGSINSASRLYNNDRRAFRIPNKLPDDDCLTSTGTCEGGTFDIHDSITDPPAFGFVSDLITVDFDIENDNGSDYRSDVVYFGTVEGESFTTNADGSKSWSGGGRLVRLKTRVLGSDDKEIATTPSQWEIKEFINVGRPITSAPAVGFDNTSYWIYFGTGRFFATDDQTDAQDQYFFGVKEPIDPATSSYGDLAYTWGKIEAWDPTTLTSSADSTLTPGNQGLWRVDRIMVSDITSHGEGLPYLYCRDAATDTISNDYSCMPTEAAYTDTDGNTYYEFNELRNYIAGESFFESDDPNNGIDGWYRKLTDERERNLSQAALLGGLATFTTYQPYEGACLSEGLSYMYAVHYQTGTAYYENIFGTDIELDETIVEDRKDLGPGLAPTPNMHVGQNAESAATAFVQTSTGEIIEVSQEHLPVEDYKTGKISWLIFDKEHVEALNGDSDEGDDASESEGDAL